MLGILNYFFMSRFLAHVGSPPDFVPFPWKKFFLTLLGCVVAVVFVALWCGTWPSPGRWSGWPALVMLGIFVMLIRRSTPRERSGLIAVLVLTAQGIIFFIFYQQMSTSLTLFAYRNVDLNFLLRLPGSRRASSGAEPDLDLHPQPPLAWAYTRLGKRSGGDLPVALKFALGFVVLALGFFVFGGCGYFASPDGKVSLWWMVLGYGLTCPRRAADQRPRAGDGCPLRATADARVADGDLVPRHRDLPVPRQLRWRRSRACRRP